MNPTTTLRDGAAAPGVAPPRLLQVAVNLLPPEITAARRGRRIRVAVVVVAAVVVLLVIAGYAAAVTRTSRVQSSVDQTQSDLDRISRQQSRYAAVAQVQAASRAISAELATLLATDVRWPRLLSALQAAAPRGVVVTSVSGTLAAPAAGGAGAKGGTAAVGTLTVNGTSTDKIVLAAFLDALARVDGLANPVLGNVDGQAQSQSFTIQADITTAALDSRYAPSATPKATPR